MIELLVINSLYYALLPYIVLYIITTYTLHIYSSIYWKRKANLQASTQDKYTIILLMVNHYFVERDANYQTVLQRLGQA